jgi:hypothetical protein
MGPSTTGRVIEKLPRFNKMRDQDHRSATAGRQRSSLQLDEATAAWPMRSDSTMEFPDSAARVGEMA